MKQLRIGVDLDDTIFGFMDPYIKRFGTPKTDNEITKNVRRVLYYDKKFWMNQPLINYPNFKPVLYCTKRVHNKRWTKQQLELNHLPKAPVYQIYAQSVNKATRIKGKVDVFIDDSISNFKEMNLSGVPCLLMDAEHNRSWGSVGRIFSLQEEEIIKVYNSFINITFESLC